MTRCLAGIRRKQSKMMRWFRFRSGDEASRKRRLRERAI
jgi:hypothetical protein